MGCSSSACAYCGKELFSYSWEHAVKHVEKCIKKMTVVSKGNVKNG